MVAEVMLTSGLLQSGTCENLIPGPDILNFLEFQEVGHLLQ